MHFWLRRLAFSFAALAVAFWWMAFHPVQHDPEGPRRILEMIAGTLLAGLAVVGLRLRHPKRFN